MIRPWILENFRNILLKDKAKSTPLHIVKVSFTLFTADPALHGGGQHVL
jgi:hypothetical protein